jgi:hypothetical protein
MLGQYVLEAQSAGLCEGPVLSAVILDRHRQHRAFSGPFSKDTREGRVSVPRDFR